MRRLGAYHWRRMVSRSQRVQDRREACREEAAQLVRIVCEPIAPFELVKVCIARSAQRLGWSFHRTQDIWRKEAGTIHAHEMDQLREMTAARGQHANLRVASTGEIPQSRDLVSR